MNFAFISRHKPTSEQVQLAAEQDIVLYHIGDADAFTVTSDWIESSAKCLPEDTDRFVGVIVVHPAAALQLCQDYIIGIFENANRAPEGAVPQFSAKALHLYDLTDGEVWN